MKPTFRNANYYRNENSEQEDENLKALIFSSVEKSSITGIHSKLILSDRQGVFIPQIFVNNFDMSVWNISESDNDLLILKIGPEHEWYWESWNVILDKAFFIDEYGYRWHLEQDGDLFTRLSIEHDLEDETEINV